MGYKANEPCVATGISGNGLVTYHHLYTRKAYPEYANETWNQIPVSLAIHNEFHSKGTSHMANKYPQVRQWLLDNGWTYEEYLKKWISPKNK